MALFLIQSVSLLLALLSNILILWFSSQLNIHLPELSPAADGQPQLPPEFKRLTGKRAQVVECEPVAVRAEGGEVRLTVRVSLPASTDWTSGAPSAWQLIPGMYTLHGTILSPPPWSSSCHHHYHCRDWSGEQGSSERSDSFRQRHSPVSVSLSRSPASRRCCHSSKCQSNMSLLPNQIHLDTSIPCRCVGLYQVYKCNEIRPLTNGWSE